MRNNNELHEAIEIILGQAEEDEEFKQRLKQLIYNYINNSYSDDDIHDVIDLVKI